MIQQQTKLKVVDNSGAKLVKCIKVLNGFKKRKAIIGNTIIITVKKTKLTNSMKKGEIHTAVIIKTKKKYKRSNGLSFMFDNNEVVLINKSNNPIFTRIFGKIPKELRTQKLLKLYTLSTGIF